MNAKVPLVVAVAAILAACAFASTVTLTLESTKNGQTVAAGTAVDWTIKASVSAGDNAGLALISVGFSQDPNNPAKFDVPAATAVPTGMTNFARPAGISNPGSAAPDFGYRGDQRGTTGQKNLVQIGGGQNTFGQAGTTIGTSTTVAQGVGQSAPQIIASGTFNAPATTGVYRFYLDSGLANTLNTVTPPPVPPAFWPVSAATVAGVPTAVLTFTVQTGPAICRGDTNCDGSINYADINPFVKALGSVSAWQAQFPNCPWQNCDLDNSGSINYGDINPFVSKLSSPGPCP